MPSNEFVIWTIIFCSIATWASRATPFAILKYFKLPQVVIEFLDFVPIVIMSALWFENLFVQHLGQLPSINWMNLFATIPTLITAILFKNLSLIVLVGVVSLAVLRIII
ncbi:AzlD domain-containing protein [Lactobacillaceae bacterium Melli_B4]